MSTNKSTKAKPSKKPVKTTTVKPTVFITRPIPEPGIALIKKHANVILRKTDTWISRKELLAGAKKADILLPILTDPIDGELLDAAPYVQLVANFGAGYNNIDVPAATERGIFVTNTPGVLTDTTAETTMALMLSAAHRIPETEAIMKAGKYPGWGPMMYLGHEMSGKTLGIVGLGRIGTRVAEMAHHGFGMNILYYTKHKERDVERTLGAKKVSLATLLKQSDFVTLHVPLTPETHHLIGKAEFKQMKSTAFIVNTSRGPVIDEKALVLALQKKDIAGAALDVYENEPAMAPGLAKQTNALLVPHIGSATRETRTAMSMLAAENIVAFIKGKPMPALINPEAAEHIQ